MVELELACTDLAGAVDGLAPLGFSLVMIMPADDPQVAIVRGRGVRLRLVRGTRGGTLRLVGDSARELVVGGLRVEMVPDAIASGGETAIEMPALVPAFVVSRDEPSAWKLGRANMLYRDLIPDRQGGRFIASHIRVPAGGPVPDYVHYHAVRFQMIYCYKGWVRLVYEDQGDPFTMLAGDCVIQPPYIRHRVLECSPGLEVLEIGSPAAHATYTDRELALPTPTQRSDREWSGQKFHAHASGGSFAAAALGIATASGGIAGARVLRRALTPACTHDAELVFGFVLQGSMSVTCGGAGGVLEATDAFVIPAGQRFEFADGSPDLAWLEVTLPARVTYDRDR